ncbi:hypothetical protein [Flexivirga alba]|uniref:DUF1624 domain-containing protein n=1 Tax=Flexivirga alba TaxID=702742 RepID=A0ABW2AFU7_9MICO
MTTGNAAALFAVLAGVSLALVTGGSTPHTGRRRHIVDSTAIVIRAGLIVVIGVLLEHLHPAGIAVILPYYGVLFVIGLPFLWLRPSRLFLVGGVWMCAAPIVSQAFRLLDPQSVAGGFGGLGVGAILLRLLVTGEYPAFTWVSYLCFGLAVGRLDLRRRNTAVGLLCAGALLAAGASLLSHVVTSLPGVHDRLVHTWTGPPVSSWAALQLHLQVGLQGVTPIHSWWWLAVSAPHSGSVADLAFTAGIALAVIGLALLATRVATRWWQVVFGAGTMTLSLYSLHLIMVLPQTWPDYGPRRLVPEVSVVVVVGIVFATLRWKGPLEAVVTVTSRTAARGVDRAFRRRRHSPQPPRRAIRARTPR